MMGTNCGFERAEHLPPNIGYLKFNMFADPAICAPTAIAALNFVADSDALILDLRNNNGGSGEMVALIASYLFDQPTHLNDSYDRSASSTRESWTLA
jgi:C-terminal processing protease CtpA/Prc